MVELPKRYYIGEVSRLVAVHSTTLKNWERDGYIPKAHRTDGIIKKRWWTEDEVREIYEWKQANYQW